MRVLIPVGGPSPTQPILDRCRRFADAGRCTVVLAHVSREPDPAPMKAFLADTTQTLRQAGLDAMYVVRDGEPRTEIARLAHDLDAHLLLPA